MSKDKPLGLRVLDAFEHYYRENTAFRMILNDRGVSGWERKLELLMSDRKTAALVREQFSEVRAALTEESDPAQALQQLLKVFPPSKDVN